MNEKQWVQHMSGKGEKWMVWSGTEQPGWMYPGCQVDADREWCVCGSGSVVPSHLLPKSEYRLCAPPEEWEDVTAKYKHMDGEDYVGLAKGDRLTFTDGPHNGPVFIIERKKSGRRLDMATRSRRNNAH
ncbi:MAG: hypothetical protein OEY77_00110 [Nitrospira sp.]|nr:hypothetical protein [Nitrospira sp.]